MSERQPLRDQSALVTGGSSGIGAAIAIAFAEAGAAVGVNYSSSGEKAETLLAEIRAKGGRAIGIKADVSREDAVRDMMAAFTREFGRIDILVSNAGLQKDAPLTEMTLEDWRAVIDVDLTGQFLCSREAVKSFLAQDPSPVSRAKGKILCMSSVHQRIPWAGHVNYAAAKGGVALLMQTIAQEVAHERIRVNAIAPGAIKTEINKDVWSDPEKSAELIKHIPYGRIGEPEDVARAAVWLASDESDYVTGTTLFIDGGMTLYPEFRDNG